MYYPKSVFFKIWILTCLLLALTNANQISFFNAEATKEELQFEWSHTCGDRLLSPVHLKSKRLIGGVEAVPNSWPFLVSIRVDWKGVSRHHCGGTIISDMHVITAAHCIIAFLQMATKYSLSITEMKSVIKVSVGRHSSVGGDLDPADEYEIDTLDFHDGFNFSMITIDNDVMLFKLKRPIVFNKPSVNIACLPDPEQTSRSLQSGQKVVAVGWGATEPVFNFDYAETLQQAVFTVLDPNDQECNSGLVGLYTWNKENNVCATGKNQVTCFGDSGGPLFQLLDNKWTLVGIISFGNDIIDFESEKRKCDPTRPFYFVNISKYIDWIHDRIDNI